nr:hypothetical protein [Hypericibacter adhaerens]
MPAPEITGASLVPAMVTVTVCVTVAPASSVTRTVKMSCAVLSARKLWAASLSSA